MIFSQHNNYVKLYSALIFITHYNITISDQNCGETWLACGSKLAFFLLEDFHFGP